MKKRLLLLLAATLVSAQILFASTNQRVCGTMEYLAQQELQDPGLNQRRQQIENQTAAYVLAQKQGQNTTQSLITIPVVFHLVYNTSAQNISDAQLQAQLSQLNLDFARMNANASSTPSVWQSIAANTNIQFCLATRDPNGNATTGINRRQTTVSAFSTNDNVKRYTNGGLDAWPASSYLNIWVCNLSGGVLGYAQFPGGSAATDGVVLLYSSIGSVAKPGTASPYHLGRTGTHEVGHWLNLYHIWGDDGSSCSGSDNVSDTPNQAGENYGCPTYPKTDGCSASSPGVMFMNYMDYTDDNCMNLFTNGQSARMNALFGTGGSRASLLSSLGCQAPGTSTCNVPTGMSTNSVTSTSAILSWGSTGAISYSVQYRVSGSSTWTSASSGSNSLSLSSLSPSTSYEWQVSSNCSGNSSAWTTSSTFTTAATASCGTPGGLSVNSITSSSATVSWTAVSGASSYTIQYRVNGSSTWTSTTSTTSSKALSGLNSSTTYQVQIMATCSGVNGSYSSIASFSTTASACSDVYESNNSSSAAKTIAANTNISAIISSSTDADWFKFTTTSPNTYVKVTLTNLPADYDIRLYNSSLSQLGISQNGGTTSESIIRNTTSAATYYIKVYGYNGVYNSGACYTLRVATGSIAFRTLADFVNNDDMLTKSSSLLVYPNPAQHEVFISLTSAHSSDVKISVIDLLGKVVYSRQVSAADAEKLSIDVSNFNKGIYLINLQNAEEQLMRKLIIEH